MNSYPRKPRSGDGVGVGFLAKGGGCRGDPELVAGVTILDAADRPVASLGFQSGADQQTGWPNDRQWVRPGLFNSPHSATADAAGNIYVVEWITGGRVTKLERL